MTTPAVQITGLTAGYGETVALDDVTLALAPGLVHGLIGMNGSGKSTLFKALMGLVRPTRGGLTLFGGAPEVARAESRVAYAPQSEAVDWGFPVSVRDVVAMGRFGRTGWRRRLGTADHQAIDEALARTELTALADRQIGALSGGQRKRAFVARGLAQGADLLLLDEPFAGVDQRTEHALSELLHELAAEGRTILISTHDLAGAPELCDEITLLYRRVVAQGAPSTVLTPELLAQAFGGFVPVDAIGGPA